MTKRHFHSFDALRFFAFLKVFLLHAPIILASYSPAWLGWFDKHVRYGGGIGVDFFFVLSGFLITYILTNDKINNGKINLKRFFVRRAFRIFPLYYLMVFMALLIPASIAQPLGFYMTGGGYEPEWIYSLTFTENIAMIIHDNVPRTTPLSIFWSLCIEEQFYIYWMIVFFFIKRQWIPIFLISSLLMAIGIRVFELNVFGNEMIKNQDMFSNLDYFAISGLLGYAVAVNYEKVASQVKKISAWFKWGYIFLVGAVLYFLSDIFKNPSWFLDMFWPTFTAILFTGLLVIFIPSDSKIRFSEKSVFTKLGKISYGLYVYHIAWVHIVYKFYIDYDIEIGSTRPYLFFVIVTFTATVITAYLSYRFFERPIMNLRERYFSNKSKSEGVKPVNNE